MCTRDILNELLKKFRVEADKIFEGKLSDMILYGSYARGDNTDESDVDVMIIADILPEEELDTALRLSELAVDLNLEFDVVLSPLVE